MKQRNNISGIVSSVLNFLFYMKTTLKNRMFPNFFPCVRISGKHVRGKHVPVLVYVLYDTTVPVKCPRNIKTKTY